MTPNMNRFWRLRWLALRTVEGLSGQAIAAANRDKYRDKVLERIEDRIKALEN